MLEMPSANTHNPGTSLIAAMAIFFKASAWTPSFYRHLAPDNFLLGQAPSKKIPSPTESRIQLR